jgi:cobalt-zinc-cadmium efflux system outer membrane protein
MDFSLVFGRTWYVMLTVWLFLAHHSVSSAIAGETFTSTPFGAGNSPHVAHKKDLTLKDALHLALQRNPELAAFDKEMRLECGGRARCGEHCHCRQDYGDGV